MRAIFVSSAHQTATPTASLLAARGGEAFSPIFGDVVLDRDGVDDSLAHGMGRLKAIAYAGVKDVIEGGILIDYDVNHKGRGYDSAVVAAPIDISGNRYICYVVITRKKGNSRFYLHEVWTIKNLTEVRSNAAQRQPSQLQGTAKILQDIVTANENSSKIVDENGEPRVVYHSGAKDINIFSREFDKTGIGRQFWGKGFYFSTSKGKDEWAKRYQDKTGKKAQIYQVFLNIKHPSHSPIKGEITDTQYDGIILNPHKTVNGETDYMFVVSAPNQIKSAEENVGTFDGGNPDIRYQFVGENKNDGREVKWVKNTIGKILRNKGFDASRLVPVIKEVFDNSVHIFSENEIIKEGHKIHSNFIDYHHYVGKIEDNGNEYYVRFTVQELNTRKKDFVPNQLHSTFISDIEIMSANTRVNTGKSPATTNISTPVDAKLQIFLETAIESKENCSKVVDENDEPRVVYHQTNSTIFVNRKTGENFENLGWKEKDYWENEASEEEWNDTWEEQGQV